MATTRTCIICSQRANSREHIFPAALGGRRTNKGIYCAQHHNDYSPLAGVLSAQLQVINALLGVRGDHADAPHTVALTDQDTGRIYRLSTERSEMEPELLAEKPNSQGGTTKSMAFSNERQVQAWLKEQSEAGQEVTITGRSVPRQRFLSGGHVTSTFGGPDGLRAIGYVAQTFLAHHFPDLARRPEMAVFKQGTLEAAQWAHDAWWTSEPDRGSLPAQPFPFGHRILVGIDADSARAYARISLFSTLHFAVDFGPIAGLPACSAMVDINPLAAGPPDDIREVRLNTALLPLQRPADMTGELSDAIRSGRAQSAFSNLLQRISDYHLDAAAEKVLAKVRAASPQTPHDRRTLFQELVEAESQRVLNLMRHVVTGLLASGPNMQPFEPYLNDLVAAEPNSPNGLTQLAFANLQIAKAALVQRMMDDDSAGQLDPDRIAMLIGGGPGAAVIGEAILAPLREGLAASSESLNQNR
jgi:hypothetical protein